MTVIGQRVPNDKKCEPLIKLASQTLIKILIDSEFS